VEGNEEFYGLWRGFWRGIRDEDEGKEMFSILAGRVGGKGRR
jgi:hypothetical protein